MGENKTNSKGEQEKPEWVIQRQSFLWWRWSPPPPPLHYIINFLQAIKGTCILLFWSKAIFIRFVKVYWLKCMGLLYTSLFSLIGPFYCVIKNIYEQLYRFITQTLNTSKISIKAPWIDKSNAYFTRKQ